jgi:hypothetical protein
MTDLIWLTTAQAAARAQNHVQTVRKALEAERAPRLAAEVAGGRWRIHVDCLDAWCLGETGAPTERRLVRGVLTHPRTGSRGVRFIACQRPDPTTESSLP